MSELAPDTSTTSADLAVDLAVELRDVTYLHPGDRGVREINLVIPHGSVLALLGPNGSGKSTILNLVAGFLQPQNGDIHMFRQHLTSDLRRRIGVLFQDTSLDPLMTVEETLWLYGRLFGMRTTHIRKRVDELLTLTDLQERRGDEVEVLSGGLKRRLELARCVLHEPDLILLDEPSLGLDPDSKAALWAMLSAINASGAALMLATNDVAEAERYGQNIAFIEQGRVIAKGTPEQLTGNLRHDSVRVEWPGAPPDIARTLNSWDGVGRVTGQLPELHITVDDASAFVPTLFQAANGAIAAIRIHESTLEDAYFQIVGRPLQVSDSPLILLETQSAPSPQPNGTPS
jgi:ABC-2 type transport system ATP-binding protein